MKNVYYPGIYYTPPKEIKNDLPKEFKMITEEQVQENTKNLVYLYHNKKLVAGKIVARIQKKNKPARVTVQTTKGILLNISEEELQNVNS